MASSLGANDLSCVDDLDAGMAEVSERLLLAQSIARAITSPRGSVIDDPDWGFDLRGYLNDDIDDRGLALIRAGIEAQCLRDERVLAATANVTLTGGVLIVTISLVDSAGPFKLVLSVSDVTTTILKVA